jgi:hypothetical protein
VSVRSYIPVDHVEIVGNGEVVAAVPVGEGGLAASGRVPLRVARSGWYVLRAWSSSPRHPVLDLFPYASTSPIHVTVAGAPIRSRADAEYFIAWIDRLNAAAESHDGWNTSAEKAIVLDQIRAARAVFAERAR